MKCFLLCGFRKSQPINWLFKKLMKHLGQMITKIKVFHTVYWPPIGMQLELWHCRIQFQGISWRTTPKSNAVFKAAQLLLIILKHFAGINIKEQANFRKSKKKIHPCIPNCSSLTWRLRGHLRTFSATEGTDLNVALYQDKHFREEPRHLSGSSYSRWLTQRSPWAWTWKFSIAGQDQLIVFSKNISLVPKSSSKNCTLVCWTNTSVNQKLF